MSADPLLIAATAARNKAFAPHSNFKVGAAIETVDGQITSGCNIELASFGLTCCAERVAIFKAYSDGQRKFRRIAVVTDTPQIVTPCGACRQVIWELCGDIEVLLRNLKGDQYVISANELLPYAFDSSVLPKK
ncbi:MAG: cytidine deaminase [Gemmataceae bacterium]